MRAPMRRWPSFSGLVGRLIATDALHDHGTALIVTATSVPPTHPRRRCLRRGPRDAPPPCVRRFFVITASRSTLTGRRLWEVNPSPPPRASRDLPRLPRRRSWSSQLTPSSTGITGVAHSGRYHFATAVPTSVSRRARPPTAFPTRPERRRHLPSDLFLVRA